MVKVEQIQRVPTCFGLADMISFTGFDDNSDHVIFGFGDWRSDHRPAVRIHCEQITTDSSGHESCNCELFEQAMEIFSESSGLVIYLRAGSHKEIAAEMLKSLGISKTCLSQHAPSAS